MKKYLTLILLFISQAYCVEITSPEENESIYEVGAIHVTWTKENPGDVCRVRLGRYGFTYPEKYSGTDTECYAIWDWGPEYLMVIVENQTQGTSDSHVFYYLTSPNIEGLNLQAGDTINSNYEVNWDALEFTFDISVKDTLSNEVYSEIDILPPLSMTFLDGMEDGQYSLTITHNSHNSSSHHMSYNSETVVFNYDSGYVEPSEPSSDQIDFSELVAWHELHEERLINIEYNTAVIAAAAGIGLGLMLWRLTLLSKNQRDII